MRIAGTQYSLKYSSFEIYLSGCDGSCPGCHNPELADWNLGDLFETVMPELGVKIRKHSLLIDWIWILGGEPILQHYDELTILLRFLRHFEKPIVLFTRFELEQIPQELLVLCDYIKTGRYDSSQSVEGYSMHGIDLATANQKVVKLG